MAKEKASPSSDDHVKAGNALSDSGGKTLLPIGWKQPLWEGKFFTPYQHGEHTEIFAWTLAVWFMTAVALSLGARFWFDLLNKFNGCSIHDQAPGEERDRKVKGLNGKLARTAAVV